ncbi:hypothetical protein EYC84_011171 [Monilinia fructicola]|uniref:Capsule polysaccharide biosynthesis protein n=1 Tax=Monilinia fructicola TaxID=38448 RepID=A0A5M9JA71_MONFR|nr:hypothetical protein EYC84_011171 [Monilinia fructicola]
MENLTGNGAAIAHSYTDSTTQNQFRDQTPLFNAAAYAVQILLQCFNYFSTWSTIWKLLFIILAIGNLKSLPLMWHLRLVNSFRFCLRSQRPKVKPGPKQIFQPMITESHAPLMEIDINFHKTNSSYFSDVDVGRTHLFCTLFSEGIEKLRGGTGPITGSKKPAFGPTACIHSRIPKHGAKSGRKTISPEFMLRASGLLPEAGTKEIDAAQWTLENVEEEKLRGKKIAETLSAETKLDMEETFTGESEALGRHTDGTGMLGIFSTLAQLLGLKKSQLL